MKPDNLSRRDWMRLAAAGALSLPTSGWLQRLAARTVEMEGGSSSRPRHKSCIMLFMTGGASHVDTFDPKPENKTSAFKPISTSASGVQVTELLPKMAEVMKDCSLLRGMSTSEGSHGRARYYMHTGYRQGVGGVVHPALGAIASARLGKVEDPLPNFVCIGGQAFSSGYAGPQHAALEIRDAAAGIENLRPADSLNAFDRRASLLEDIEQGFLDRRPGEGVEAHAKTYQRAVALMHSAKAKAFDISQESSSAREMYGTTKVGQACLLARRLVENGVSFVEIPVGGWDTHRDNTGRLKTLCGEIDQPMAALIADLKQRGMLDSTLVIWMGDFGRTPHVGKQGGRDHYPKAWTSLLAGAGIRTGQAIGKTDKQGATVVEGKVTAIDFMATVCKALDIDYTKEFHTRDGRPMRTVDKGGRVVKDLF